jgi:hypothetical protein
LEEDGAARPAAGGGRRLDRQRLRGSKQKSWGGRRSCERLRKSKPGEVDLPNKGVRPRVGVDQGCSNPEFWLIN